MMGLADCIEAKTKNKKVIAIIPARGGSKRLHKKNIYPIWGKPMIHWPIKAAKESKYISDVWVTTENEEISKISTESGAKVHKRNPKLSEDHVFKMEAIRNCFDEIGRDADIVVSLQANSPEITCEIIDNAIETFIENDRNELFSVGKDLMMNAAFRIMKGWYVFQKDLSTKTGSFVCDLIDVHTAEDVNRIEVRNEK